MGIAQDETGDVSERVRHLIERSVQTVSFPDRIYAIGGGGRKMVLELLGQDWVAVEAMRGRTDPIRVVFLDTATENEENHEEEIEELKDQINRLEKAFEEETSMQTDVGRIEIESKIITESLNIGSQSALTGDRTVERIKNNTNIDHWWLRPAHTTPTSGGGDIYDVSKGAVKRRGLGKALHYKAMAQGGSSEYKDLLTLRQENDVAIFTGLGGGTGSGIFIDVANRIKDRAGSVSIRLFATMPATTQRDEARNNAFAALGELEHLTLSREEENPFNDVFLIPLEPTEISREQTTHPELTELDRVLAYPLISVYNSDDVDYALGETNTFAPFTVVVPQTIHYNRDEIKSKTEEIKSLLGSWRRALELEHYIFESVGEYLTDQYPDSGSRRTTGLSDSHQAYLTERLERFEQFLTTELFEALELDVDHLRTRLLDEDIYGEDFSPEEHEIGDVLREREMEDLIDSVELFMQTYEIEGGVVDQYGELDVDYLRDVLHTELAHIVEAYELFQRLEAAREVALSSDAGDVATDVHLRLLETVADPTTTRDQRKHRYKRTKDTRDDFGGRVQEIRAEIRETENAITDEREAVEESLEQYVAQFERSVGETLSEYQQLRSLDLSPTVSSFERSMKQYLRNVEDAEDPRAIEERQEVEEAFDEVTRELGAVDSLSTDEFITESELRETLDLVVEARELWEELGDDINSNDGGILSDVFSSGSPDTLQTASTTTFGEN
ncbi:MAG: tubulin-like doman-containing protein [Halobaculum sp.]